MQPQHQRISENVYWFQSEVYAQVTAGVVTGPQWAAVIDTLATPDETIEMRTYIEEELNVPVRYIINTHNHADHTWGNCFFPGATLIAHSLCRSLSEGKGQEALETARHQNPIFKQVRLIFPHLTFDQGQLSLRIGKKNLILIPTPGHSNDSISVLVEEDRILFTGDAFLPLPYFVDGDVNQMAVTIKNIGKMGLENIVQGHGDIILRGEIEDAAKENLAYLSAVRKAVRNALRRKNPLEFLTTVDIESCKKSRVLLGGLAEELHKRNLVSLYRKMAATPESEEDAAESDYKSF